MVLWPDNQDRFDCGLSYNVSKKVLTKTENDGYHKRLFVYREETFAHLNLCQTLFILYCT